MSNKYKVMENTYGVYGSALNSGIRAWVVNPHEGKKKSRVMNLKLKGQPAVKLDGRQIRTVRRLLDAVGCY